MRWFIRLLTALFAAPLLYVAAALIGAVVPGSHVNLPAGADTEIGLVRGPIHFDLLLPLTPDLRRHFGFAALRGVPVDNPWAQWLVVGWGARNFYTTVGDYADLNGNAVWRGVVGDSAVMHLDVAGDVHKIAGIGFISLSNAQFDALIQAVDASFLFDQTGNPVSLNTLSLGRHDAFYLATGSFNILHTCNDWVGETLRAAGVPFGVWTPIAQSVILSLRWHAPN